MLQHGSKNHSYIYIHGARLAFVEDRVKRLLDVVPHIRNVSHDVSKKLREYGDPTTAKTLDTAMRALTAAVDAFLTETQPIGVDDDKES